MHRNRSKCCGFTLIELLVSIAIVVLMGGLLLPAISYARSNSKMVTEVSAARQLISAYLRTPMDNGGQLMKGYDRDATAQTKDGSLIHYPASARYPWRLAPYVDYQLSGTMFVNEQANLPQTVSTGGVSAQYEVSVTPSLGMNTTFIGGYYDEGGLNPRQAQYGNYVVTHPGLENTSQLIVFASAYLKQGSGNLTYGMHQIEPPYLLRRQWSAKYDANSARSQHWGNVHPRYKGKAVVASLGGQVELLNTTQLQDMRRWSQGAAEADSPTWTLKKISLTSNP